LEHLIVIAGVLKKELPFDYLTPQWHVEDGTDNFMVPAVKWTSANAAINDFFDESRSTSRHNAATNCIRLFNRFSEECLDPRRIRKIARNPTLRKLVDLYGEYRESLRGGSRLLRISLFSNKPP